MTFKCGIIYDGTTLSQEWLSASVSVICYRTLCKVLDNRVRTSSTRAANRSLSFCLSLRKEIVNVRRVILVTGRLIDQLGGPTASDVSSFIVDRALDDAVDDVTSAFLRNSKFLAGILSIRFVSLQRSLDHEGIILTIAEK